jgi:peptidoglycan-associated lipoprotein
MQKSLLVLIAISVAAIAVGCSSKKPRPSATNASTSASAPSDQSQSSGADDANARGIAGAPGTDAAGPSSAQLQNRTIYFDFDSSDIKAEYNDLITAHARYLAANPSMKVRLEGNTDERGSREYNIGLGERRAQSLRRALMLQGVTESQLTTVSYGEERPAVTGHAEDAWARNRRANIVYVN